MTNEPFKNKDPPLKKKIIINKVLLYHPDKKLSIIKFQFAWSNYTDNWTLLFLVALKFSLFS